MLGPLLSCPLPPFLSLLHPTTPFSLEVDVRKRCHDAWSPLEHAAQDSFISHLPVKSPFYRKILWEQENKSKQGCQQIGYKNITNLKILVITVTCFPLELEYLCSRFTVKNNYILQLRML